MHNLNGMHNINNLNQMRRQGLSSNTQDDIDTKMGFMDRVKLTSRALHLVSGMALSGSIIFDYYTDNALHSRISKHRHFAKYHTAFGILLFVTGVLNTFFY